MWPRSGKKAERAERAERALALALEKEDRRRAVQAGAKMGGGSSSSSATSSTCNAKATVTGFELQRQVLNGWTTVSPAPTANDTAVEVGGLEPGTKYCFRMRSQSSPEASAYTKTFCAKTSSSSTSSSSSSSSSSDTSSTSSTAPAATPTPTPSATTDPTGAGSQPAAAVIIENLSVD